MSKKKRAHSYRIICDGNDGVIEHTHRGVVRLCEISELERIIGKKGKMKYKVIGKRMASVNIAVKFDRGIPKDLEKDKLQDLDYQENIVYNYFYLMSKYKENEILLRVQEIGIVSLQRLYQNEMDEIVENKRKLYDFTRCIIRDVLKALEIVHSNGFLHLDVSLNNILMFIKDSDHFKENKRLVAKLNDFELVSKDCYGKTLEGSNVTFLGSPAQMSPEMVVLECYNGKHDIYGLGVIAYLFLTGGYQIGGLKKPNLSGTTDSIGIFPKWPTEKTDDNYRQFLKDIETIHDDIFDENGNVEWFPDYLDDIEKDFLNGLLNRNQEKRLNATEALAHPFLQRIPDIYLEDYQFIIPYSPVDILTFEHEL